MVHAKYNFDSVLSSLEDGVLEDILVHASASSTAFREDLMYDMVRIGSLAFGVSSLLVDSEGKTVEIPRETAPTSSLFFASHLVDLRMFTAGTRFGPCDLSMHCRWSHVVHNRTLFGTIPVGYIEWPYNNVVGRDYTPLEVVVKEPYESYVFVDPERTYSARDGMGVFLCNGGCKHGPFSIPPHIPRQMT